MAKGDINIRFETSQHAAPEEIQALMRDYAPTSGTRLAAQNQGSELLQLTQDANAQAAKTNAPRLTLDGSMGTALNAAYSKQHATVEITHTLSDGILGMGAKSEVLCKATITPEIAQNLLLAVAKIGEKLENHSVQCNNGTLSSAECEAKQQNLPKEILQESLKGQCR